jgi:polyferredoxin
MGRALVRQDRSRRLWPAAYVLCFFLGVGLLLWAVEGSIASPLFFGLIGVSTGSGFLIAARASRRRRGLGRRLSLALVGLSLFLGAGVFGRQSFQLEGFFFHVTAGVLGGVVIHYLVAKILGPLLIGRAFCGWGCWIWMVLDQLPWTRSPPRKEGAWPRLRELHFGLSFALVATLSFGLGYDHGFEWKRTDGLYWFLGGCAAYYALGVALAAALKDNRAFCKYACPVSVFLRSATRLSLLKVAGTRDRCTRCGTCDTLCPMGVKVSWYVQDGTRVLDPECTLCQTCVTSCPEGNLGLSLGLDVGTTRLPPRPPPQEARLRA